MGFKATIVSGVGAPVPLPENFVPKAAAREALTRNGGRQVSFVNGVAVKEAPDPRNALNGLGELVQVVT